MSLYLITLKVEWTGDMGSKKVAHLVEFPNEPFLRLQIECTAKFSPKVGDIVSLAIYQEEENPNAPTTHP